MPSEVPRPLHRMTPLGDDPAAAWLSAGGRLRVGLTGVLGWGTFAVAVLTGYLALRLAILGVFFRGLPRFFGLLRNLKYVPVILTGMLVLAILPFVRRAILRRKSARLAASIRRSAPAEALTIDDWTELQNAPEDQPISVVGWARARSRLVHPVGGELCIGLALPCQQSYPGILETSHDFDLVDELGQSIAILVAGGRLMGEATADLGGGDARLLLVASLDLPSGATPSGWSAYLLRDGDPLLILGFKRSIADPTERGLRQLPARTAIASQAPRPLLIFPLDAERRVGTGWG